MYNNRVQMYKSYIRSNGEYLSPNEMSTTRLAWECRQSAPMKWQCVKNNTLKAFEGEKLEERYNPDTGKREVWKYCHTLDFDQNLFSNLYIRINGIMDKLWSKYHEQLPDEEEFLDEMDTALLNAIVRYDKSKGSFTGFVYLIMDNACRNLLQKHYKVGTIKDEITGKRINKYDYSKREFSLEGIQEDPQNPFNYQLPFTQIDKRVLLRGLVNKYKNENDMVAFLYVDLATDRPEVFDIKMISEIVPSNYKITNKIIYNIYNCIYRNNLHSKLGFKHSDTCLNLSESRFFRICNKAKNKIAKDVVGN